jgi:hypothetical protein
MATKDSQIPVDLKFAEFLYPYTTYCRNNEMTLDLLLTMVSRGHIQIESILESALADNSEELYIKESVDSRDFSDGSDAKKCTTRWRGERSQYSAAVTGIENKDGNLRVVCYERNGDRFRFLNIPISEYGGMIHIELPFDVYTYEPKRSNRWWQYEVESFEALAKSIGETVVLSDTSQDEEWNGSRYTMSKHDFF